MYNHLKPHLDGKAESEDKTSQTDRQMQKVLIFHVSH